MNIGGPEITITVCTKSFQEDEHTRWQTEDAPSFPHPLCVALPPRRPDRQVSATHNNNERKDTNEVKSAAAAPRRPRRRLTLEVKLPLPPQRPTRQESATRDSMHSTFLLCSQDESMTTSTIDELSDEDASWNGNKLRESIRLYDDEAEEAPEGSKSRDLSPTRPVRQRSAPREERPSSLSALDAPSENPAWVKLWQSQAPGNNSLSGLWQFEN